MGYRILFTDLDGTLLDSRSEISPANRAAFDAAFDAGKQVVICSGRSWRSLDYFERRLGLIAPERYGLAFQGGVAYETLTKRLLHEQAMDYDTGAEVLRELEKWNADIVLYAGSSQLVTRDSPYIAAYGQKAGLPLTYVADFGKLDGPIQKILVTGATLDLEALERAMKPIFGGRCNIFFSAGDLLEFTHPDAHKGNGLRFLSAYLNIPMEETIAVGDQANDIEMLRAAGLGIAVANAADGAKAAADVVLAQSNDEDAVSRAIYTYLLS